MRDDHVELLVGGVLYAGWEQVGVTRAMDAAAGTYNLTVTDRWSPGQQPWEINPGDECEIRIGGQTVISGYVDIVRPSFGAESHSIQVQGRDRSADMIDCSAVHSPDEWKNIGLLDLANKLGGPFGVSARAEVSVGAAIDLVKLQHGETALEALVRHAKMRKVLVMPDGKGGILLTRAGNIRAEVELVQGENMLEAGGTLDWSDRYSDYTVKGQAGYRKETDGDTESHASATVKDAGMTRYRPLLIVADTEASSATARERATWEANTRIGKSAEAQVVVQGWRQTESGPLWAPNLLIRVRSTWLRIDGEMLIRQVTFSKSDNAGTTTRLDLVSPQTYEPEPPDGKQRKKGKKGSGSKSSEAWMSAIGEDVRNA